MLDFEELNILGAIKIVIVDFKLQPKPIGFHMSLKVNDSLISVL